jgi:hypothetical protein
VAVWEGGSGGIKATPKLSCKLLQVQRVLSKPFQRMLWPFCGISMRYKGRKSKGSISKLFRRFVLLSASFQTSSRRIPPYHAVAEHVQQFAGDCVAGGRGARSWRWARDSFCDTGKEKFEHSTNSDSGKGKFDTGIDAAQLIHRGHAQGGRGRRMSGRQLYCPDVIDNAISPG